MDNNKEISANEILQTGTEMILEAFQHTKLSPNFLAGLYAKAAYSHSPTLTPEPTEKEKDLQDKIIKVLDKKGFEGKAILGFGSNIMLTAEKVITGSVDHDMFVCQVQGSIQKIVDRRTKKLAMVKNNSGVFDTQTYKSTVTHSRVSSFDAS